MGDRIRLDDEEFERLEFLRRHGDRYYGDDDADDYYTLPPPRAGLMHEWTSWRTVVNDMMCDAITKLPSSEELKRERDILTSPTDTKTPLFFRGEMSVQGQRFKDQYGAPVIEEGDDLQTRQEKKIMEGNFYLFGIPRISLRRCFDKQLFTNDSRSDSRHHDSSESGNDGSLKGSDINASRRDSDSHSTSEKRASRGLVRR